MGRINKTNRKRPQATIEQQVEIARLYITRKKTIDEIHILYPYIAERTLYGYTENPNIVARVIEGLTGLIVKKLIENADTNPAYLKLLLENIMHLGTPDADALKGLSNGLEALQNAAKKASEKETKK